MGKTRREGRRRLRGGEEEGLRGERKEGGKKGGASRDRVKEEEGGERRDGRREKCWAGRPNNGAAHLMVNLNGG